MSTESNPLLPKVGKHDQYITARHPADTQFHPATEEIEGQAETAVIHRAAEVLGDRADSLRWLGTPVRALDYATPISLLHDSKGREQVLSLLGRLEHGVL